MEIVDITTETARIRMYQCGQAKTDSRCVGELNIPLPLVRVLYPKEQEKTSEKKKPILSSNDIKHEIDQSLREAMSKDDLLNSIDVASIPKPQWMPLIYSWDNFTAHNGDLLLSMWMVPKGGSLFGEVKEEHIYSTILENEKLLNIPPRLKNLCAEKIVPVPIAVLRTELWMKESPVMKSHFDEKGFKDITVGEWVSNNAKENKNGIQRKLQYLFPASSMVSANIAYEEQEIRSSEDVKGGFVVRSITQNPDVIYGKSFKTENQFVFEWASPTSTKITISSQVNFLGSRPFVAGSIENGVKVGTMESSEKLVDLLLMSSGGTSHKKKKKKNDTQTKRNSIMVCGMCLLILLGYLTGFYIHAPSFFSPKMTKALEVTDEINNDILVPKKQVQKTIDVRLPKVVLQREHFGSNPTRTTHNSNTEEL